MTDGRAQILETALDGLARHRIGFARIAADGTVLERRGVESSWLPAPGRSCLEAPLLAGYEAELRALREGRAPVLALPNVGFGAADEKSTITIAWDEAEQAFSVATARAFGASDTERMLVRERRERRLADEQAEAARRRARINEALYRDIVESGADLVLRLTPDRRIAFANSRLLALSGRDLPALIGRDAAEILPPAEGASWDVIGGGGDLSFEQRLTDAAGESVWIWWRAAWLGADGGPFEYQAVGRDVTLLKKLQAEVERAHAQARSALVMRERLKIAHDLHDTIVHALVAVVAQLRLVRKLAERAPERVAAELEQAEKAAREGLDRGRAALGQVRFQRAGVEGLAAALRRAVARFEERTGVAVSLQLDAGVEQVAGETAEILYRIAEEALRNVESHARARSVKVTATLRQGEIDVAVVDDGRGFDPAGDNPGHYGLQGMDEQAQTIGGRLSVESGPGRGASVIVRAPADMGEQECPSPPRANRSA